MALLPDPTTAASERSSVKNRLTGSRRRGSGINSKASLRGRYRVQAHPERVQGQSRGRGVQGSRFRGVQGASRGGSMGVGAFGAMKAKTPKTKKN